MERPREGLSGAVAGPSAVAPHAATKSVDSTPEGAATGLLSVGGAEMDVEADAAAGDGAEQNGARWTKRQSSGACARRGVPKLSSSVGLRPRKVTLTLVSAEPPRQPIRLPWRLHSACHHVELHTMVPRLAV